MRKLSIEFTGALSLTAIDNFYSNVREAIRTKYSDTLNINYLADFFGRSPNSVEEERDRAYEELEKEATLCLLSYMESIFRTDFILRCELKKKDKLAILFRKTYSPTKRKYQYGFKDVVIKGWKEVHPDKVDAFNHILEMMEFRNWLAHGRYWVFKDNPNKYTYTAVHSAIEAFENTFNGQIQKPSRIGMPIH